MTARTSALSPGGYTYTRGVPHTSSTASSYTREVPDEKKRPAAIASEVAEQLLQRKLKDPSLKLSSDESIALLSHCIEKGKVEARNAHNKDLIIFIGNTGAGKSTFVNYLYGCKMVRKDPAQLGITGLDKVVIVKSKQEGGPCDEVMKIGHSKLSMTFMPHIVLDAQGRAYCDCPGFLDNRGVEINIANAVNIKKAFTNAQSVRIVILINYHTLKADRGRGLSDMIEIACDLFGSKENLIQFQDSILLGITQIPLAAARDEEDDDDSTPTLRTLQEWIADTELQDPFAEQTLKSLAEKVFIYDPLDNPHLQYNGSWKKDQILHQIDNLTPISEPLTIFRTVLTAADEKGLKQICDEIKLKIKEVFAQKELSENDFRLVAGYQENLNQLEVIEHAYVTKLVEETRSTIASHFKKMQREFEIKCVDLTADLSKQADALLMKLKTGLQYFDEQMRNEINVSELEARLDLYRKKFEAKQLAMNLQDLEKAFRDHCSNANFVEAQKALASIKAKLAEFDQKYGSTGIAHGISIGGLESVYNKSKQNYDIIIIEKQRQAKEIEDLKKAQKKLQEDQKKKEAELARIIEENRKKEEARKVAEKAAKEEAKRIEAERKAREEKERKEREAKEEKERKAREKAKPVSSSPFDSPFGQPNFFQAQQQQRAAILSQLGGGAIQQTVQGFMYVSPNGGVFPIVGNFPTHFVIQTPVGQVSLQTTPLGIRVLN